jgi:hypothetical protein
MHWVWEGFSAGIEWLGQEADNSPPDIGEVNAGAIPLRPYKSPWRGT